MTSGVSKNYRVTYYPYKVVLQGDTRKIHIEAYRILEAFRSRSLPYCLSHDSNHLIELSVRA